MAKNKLKLRLTLDVKYDLDGENPQELKANLEYMVSNAMGNGLVTGDGPATVDSYKHKVEVVS